MSRILIVLGVLALAGCATTSDYRHASSGGDYYYGDSGYAGGDYYGGGYYNDGYYGGSVGYGYGYGGSYWNGGYWGGYRDWNMLMWPAFGYPRYGALGWGYASYPFGGFWPGYWGRGWGWRGGLWSSVGFGFYDPYWYWPHSGERNGHRRDVRALRTEQLRQVDWRRQDRGRQPAGSIRMWPGASRPAALVDRRIEHRDKLRHASEPRAPILRAQPDVRHDPRVPPLHDAALPRSQPRLMPRDQPAWTNTRRAARPAPISRDRVSPSIAPSRAEPRSQPRATPRSAPQPTSTRRRAMPQAMRVVVPHHGESNHSGHDQRASRIRH